MPAFLSLNMVVFYPENLLNSVVLIAFLYLLSGYSYIYDSCFMTQNVIEHGNVYMHFRKICILLLHMSGVFNKLIRSSWLTVLFSLLYPF